MRVASLFLLRLVDKRNIKSAITLAVRQDGRIARRRISGYSLPAAGALLDATPLAQDLKGGFTPQPALLALLAGDSGPLRELLDAEYVLQLDFVLALTARRDLVLRPEFRYQPLPGHSTLPAGLPLRPRRLARDELHLLALRACGMA